MKKNSISQTISVKILPENCAVLVKEGDTLLEALLKNKIEISHSCGGMGTCGTCRVFVLEGVENFDPRNEIEQEMANDRGFSADERLCCQTELSAKNEGLVIKRSKS